MTILPPHVHTEFSEEERKKKLYTHTHTHIYCVYFTCSHFGFLSDEEAMEVQRSDKVIDEHRGEQAADGRVEVKGQPQKKTARSFCMIEDVCRVLLVFFLSFIRPK